ncbi:MAG: hypothetical protein ACR2M4_11305 [Actinomycetota bacterium]
MKYEVVFDVEISGARHAVEAHLDAVMSGLVDQGAEDPFIGTDFAKGKVELSMTVDAQTEEEALAKAASQVGRARNPNTRNKRDVKTESVPDSRNGSIPPDWEFHLRRAELLGV